MISMAQLLGEAQLVVPKSVHEVHNVPDIDNECVRGHNHQKCLDAKSVVLVDMAAKQKQLAVVETSLVGWTAVQVLGYHALAPR